MSEHIMSEMWENTQIISWARLGIENIFGGCGKLVQEVQHRLLIAKWKGVSSSVIGVLHGTYSLVFIT